MYWGFCGAMAFGVVAYAFKPDTRYVFETMGTMECGKGQES
jgi:hypothetical protein